MHAVERCVRSVSLTSIILDAELCPRATMNEEVIQEYAERMKYGVVFPPVLLFSDGTQSWLVDGYHRVAAARVGGLESLVCEIRQGTREDALWAGCNSNRSHGLRRSNADKRLCVMRALSHPRGQRLSDRQIGQHCGVHHYTVGRCRQELERSGEISQIRDRNVTRGGSQYIQNTHGIERANGARARRDPGTPRANQLVASQLSEVVRDRSSSDGDVIASSLAHIDGLIAKAESEIQTVTRTLAAKAETNALPDLPEARSACLRIRQASEVIYTLLAKRAASGPLRFQARCDEADRTHDAS